MKEYITVIYFFAFSNGSCTSGIQPDRAVHTVFTRDTCTVRTVGTLSYNMLPFR
jgi:hypothetical protein